MPFNNLPHSRNPYFTGRDDKLEIIRNNFLKNDMVSLIQSVSGLGGVGKTSIAIEYAYRHSHEYETIWWINAENTQSTFLSLKDFLLKKGIISEKVKEKDILESMKYWFNNNKNWLFIYDNADSDDFNKWLEPFFPQNRNGHILITTRSNFFPKSKSIDIVVFSEDESVSFLSKRTVKNGEGYSDDLAKKLSERLQYLPLALEQAAAYIVETPSVTYQDYINLIDKYGIDIFQKKNFKGNDFYLVDYFSIINITWKISMDKIAKDSAIQMFNMCAYFAPNRIPINIFIRGKDFLPENLKQSITDDFARNEIIRDLTKYSLLSCEKEESLLNEEKRVLYMHRLLQEVVQKSFGTDFGWLVYCLDLMYNIIDWKEHIKESMNSFKQEALHAITVAEKSAIIFKNDYERIDNATEIFCIVSKFYSKLSYLELSLSCINNGIEIIERICLKENSAYNNLVMAYTHRGLIYNLMAAYDKAIEDHSRSIATGEDLLAKKELVFEDILAIAYMNRGISYENLKKYDKALSDKNKAIEIFERVCKERKLNDENNLALSYMNRGTTYESMTKYDVSLTDFNKSIEIWERMKSEGKIINENNLAIAYTNKNITSAKVLVEKNKGSLSKGSEATYNKTATIAQLNYRKKQLSGGKNNGRI